MASRTIVELTDDLDGKPATETLRFGLDGREYEVDLSEKNAKALRKVLEPWAAAGRRVSGRRGTRGTARGSASRVEIDVDNAAVRARAASNGIELSAGGRLPRTSSSSTAPPATDHPPRPAGLDPRRTGPPIESAYPKPTLNDRSWFPSVNVPRRVGS
jgi:hypothetical protein